MSRSNRWIVLLALLVLTILSIQNSNAESQFLTCKVSGDYIMKNGGGRTQPDPAIITVEIIKGNGYLAIHAPTSTFDYQFGAFNESDTKYKSQDFSTSQEYSLSTKIPSNKEEHTVVLNRITGDLSVTNMWEKQDLIVRFSGKCEPIQNKNKF